MADLRITNVTLPSGIHTDLGVRAGRLADPQALTRPQMIDASGLIALPGLVDLHTHLREPSSGGPLAETVATGTAAAAHGGFTAVFAMANTNPVCDTAEKVRSLLRRARTANAEVVPVGAITAGLLGGELSQIEAMHAEGVTYFSDDGRCVMDAGVMRQALLTIGLFGGVAAQHAQDHCLAGDQACFPDEVFSDKAGQGSCVSPECWPWAAESVIVARDAQLGLDTGAHVHVCHVSTAESVDVIRWAKARGIPITAEVTPHHLYLGSELLASRDTRYKVNPPLRGSEDRDAVRQALADGTIDVVATDHAPHLWVDKDKPFPEAKPGMVGLEYALGVVIETMVNSGLLDWEGVADRMSHAPARIGQISDRQGRPLEIGEPATLTLIDPSRRTVVDKNSSMSMGRNNPYDGMDLPDPVVMTLWNGRVTYRDPILS